MCESGTTLKLCTCAVTPHALKKALSEEIEFLEKNEVLDAIVWTLTKAVLIEEDTGMDIMGMTFGPDNSVEKLDSQFVVEQLNAQNCFDFEYTPQEQDKLIMNYDWKIGHGMGRKERSQGEETFIFSEGKWGAAFTDDFAQPTVDITKTGVVRLMADDKEP